MRGAESVVFRFLAPRKTGEALPHAQVFHRITATGEDLVAVGLVTDIPYQAVVRRVEHVMQCDGEFNRAEIRRQMAAGLADRLHQIVAQFLGHARQLAALKQTQFGRRCNGFQQFVLRTVPLARAFYGQCAAHQVIVSELAQNDEIRELRQSRAAGAERRDGCQRFLAQLPGQ